MAYYTGSRGSVPVKPAPPAPLEIGVNRPGSTVQDREAALGDGLFAGVATPISFTAIDEDLEQVRAVREGVPVASVVPVERWIQGVRTAMFPGGVNGIGGTDSLWTQLTGSLAPDTTTTVVVLLATGALVTLAATSIFRVSERRARDRGLLDRTTGS